MSTTIAEALRKALAVPQPLPEKMAPAPVVTFTPVETERQLSKQQEALAFVVVSHELTRRYANQVAKSIIRRLRYQVPAHLDWAERCVYIKDFLLTYLRDELRTFQVSTDHQEYAFQLVASQFVEELGWLERQGEL